MFGVQPARVFELAGLPPVGKCAMRSLTVKTLERRSDGVIVPHRPEPPLSVIEFHFGENPQIYTRTVQKMAAVQEEFNMREVQGVIFFAEQRLDPRAKTPNPPACWPAPSATIMYHVRQSFQTDRPRRRAFPAVYTHEDRYQRSKQ